MEEYLKIVLQDGNKDCGICCLLSIIRYYGGDVSKEYLRELTNTTRTGVSFYHLLQGASQLGFRGEGVQGDLVNISTDNLPCIAHLIISKSYQHFVVIYSIDLKKKQVVIMDPAKGKRVLALAEVKLLSSGYFLYLQPIKPIPKVGRHKNILQIGREFIGQRKNMFFMLICCSLLSLVCQIISAFHFKYLLEQGVIDFLNSNILMISTYVFLFYLFQIIFDLFRGILLGKLMASFDEVVTSYVYQQILLLPYLFFKNRTIGEIVARIQDLSVVKEFFFKMLSLLISDLLVIVVFFIFLFYINKTLTGIIFIYFVISFIFIKLMHSLKKKSVKKYQRCNDQIQSFLIESFGGMDAMKGLHLEQRFFGKFKQKYQKYLVTFYQTLRILEIEQFIKNGLYFFLFLWLYAIGSYLIVSLKLSLADFIVYQSIFNYLVTSFVRVNNLLVEIYQVQSSMERVEELFTISKENFKGGSYYQLDCFIGDIEAVNLSYRYSVKPLFERLNFVIPKGEKVLLTGESGSGKSSLVKMLMRYIDLPFGMLNINGRDINHYHLDVLRNRISYVTGNELLFSDTIYYNIALGREISLEKVKEVTTMVLAGEIIDQDSLGYQRMVEENGFNFSGGERQRLILARTLLKDSDIYIFDEAFNQIDADKERLILTHMFDYLKERTVIIISHRLANCDLFDLHLELREGQLYETKNI